MPVLASYSLIKESKPCVSSFLLLPLSVPLSASPLARRKPLKNPPKLQTLPLPMQKPLLTMQPLKLAKLLKLLATPLNLLVMLLKQPLTILHPQLPSNLLAKAIYRLVGGGAERCRPLALPGPYQPPVLISVSRASVLVSVRRWASALNPS